LFNYDESSRYAYLYAHYDHRHIVPSNINFKSIITLCNMQGTYHTDIIHLKLYITQES